MFLQKIRNVSKLKIKFQATNCSSGHVEGSFDKFLKFFGQKSEKFLLKNWKNSGKKTKKNFFSAIFTLDTWIEFCEPCQMFLQKIRIVSKLKKNQATNCSSGHVEGSFYKVLKFFGQNSEKFLLKIRKKFWKENKKTVFFRNFYSGHVDRILWAMPNVSAENPKRFKT